MTGAADPVRPEDVCATGDRRRRWRAIAAAILSAACWGGATVMSKSALAYMPPLTLLAIQLAVSITVLWLAVLALRRRVRLDRHACRASLSGVLEPGLSYVLGVAGLALTTASNTALIGAAEPLFILFLAWFFLKERIGARMLGLAAIVVFGIIMVIAPDATAFDGQGSLVGDALVIAGTVFAALYVIATRRLVTRSIAPLPLSALQQSVGFVWTLGVLAGALLFGLTTLGLSDVPAPVLLLASVSGVIQYALAFWLYLFALQSLPANVAGFYLALIPVFGLAAAFVFLGEALTMVQWVGAGCVIIAVAAMSRR